VALASANGESLALTFEPWRTAGGLHCNGAALLWLADPGCFVALHSGERMDIEEVEPAS
jgi:hypothetical protein